MLNYFRGVFFDYFVLSLVHDVQAFVCKIPPLTSTDGHKAESWGDRTPIWDGRLRIVINGTQLTILLEHTRGAEGSTVDFGIQNDLVVCVFFTSVPVFLFVVFYGSAGTLFVACPISQDPKLPPSVEYGVLDHSWVTILC